MTDILFWAAVAAAGGVAGSALVRLTWHAIGVYRISRAGPRKLVASRHRIWRDPGDVARLDLTHGPGG